MPTMPNVIRRGWIGVMLPGRVSGSLLEVRATMSLADAQSLLELMASRVKGIREMWFAWDEEDARLFGGTGRYAFSFHPRPYFRKVQ